MLWVISSIESEEDRTFVETIYIKYEKRMYVIANSILKDHHDSEDCVHETIKIIIDCLDKFKSAYANNALNTLVMITCKNCAINMYNKRNKRYKNQEEAFDFTDIPDSDPTLDELFINQYNHQTLVSLIKQLEPIYQDVVTLRIMDFNYNDIARLLNISPQNARQRMQRAKNKLIESGGRFIK